MRTAPTGPTAYRMNWSHDARTSVRSVLSTWTQSRPSYRMSPPPSVTTQIAWSVEQPPENFCWKTAGFVVGCGVGVGTTVGVGATTTGVGRGRRIGAIDSTEPNGAPHD